MLKSNRSRFLKALRGLPNDRPPVWLMRQAGRCLPEYSKLREKRTFRELINTPELAAQVTLQPISRFHFDAAIIFSDILVISEALGLPFQFREDTGLQMERIKSPADIQRLNERDVPARLGYVAKALELVHRELGGRSALLGFAGAPWTLANFMLEGGGTRCYSKALALFKTNRHQFDTLMEKITEATIAYLKMQIDCGVDAVQIFDSLGGVLSSKDFEAASCRWIGRIVRGLQNRVPVILFAKGSREWDSQIATRATIISVDHGIDLHEADRHLSPSVGIQGNLNPALLVSATPEIVQRETAALLEKMRGRAGYIFNLGHGVPPDAKLENLEALVSTVQQFT